MGKKFLSAVLCAALLASIAPTAVLSASADTTADYGLAEKTSDGVILHAFDWSYNTIKDNLPAIAEAGYTSVQTSPVQAPKDYGSSKDTSGQWWKLYQPLSFSVATKNSWLGTKQELTELCAEADKYGIKIICDIVSNHMASGDTANSVASEVNDYEPEIYSDYKKYFHQIKGQVNDSSIEKTVQGKLSSLPDVNTGDEYIQERVISLLKECIDCGVDGFRFDAAKHIETPDDGDYSSNFWPNIINTATEYAKTKDVDLYCYGEILNSPGSGRDTASYTKYLDVTDNKTGDITLAQIVNKNAANVVKAQTYASNDKGGASFTYGDVDNNGTVNSADALLILRASVKLETFNDTQTEQADVDQDGSITSKDSLQVLRFSVALKDKDTLAGTKKAAEVDPSSYVLWAESHDTYMGDSGSGGIANTSNVSNENIAKAWAIVASRSESKALYFARPGALMDQMEDTAWKSTAVSEINKFHNKFIGVSDEVYNDGDVVAVQRGDSGIVLVNLGSSSNINVTTKGLKDGTYTEAISGNTFTVKSGKISGTIGDSGIAVIYEGSSTTPNIDFSVLNKTSFKTDTLNVTLTLDNATSGTYSINGAEPVTFSNSAKIKIGEDITSGDITVKVTATNGTKTVEATQTYTKVEAEHTGLFVYLNKDGNKVTKSWKHAFIYAFYEEKDSNNKVINTTTNGSWPGVPMDYDDETGTYYYELPVGLNIGEACVIFNDAAGNQTGSLLLTENEMIYDNDKFYNRNSVPDDGDKKSENTFYLVNNAGWVFDYGAKLWLVNNETGETIETIKESPTDDSSKYAYVELPKGWTNISVYRTDYDVSEITSSTTIHNKWNCGTITEGSNAVLLKDDNKSKFTKYNP